MKTKGLRGKVVIKPSRSETETEQEPKKDSFPGKNKVRI